jgi:asparagine synthase (glutamine-hydrolysing)
MCGIFGAVSTADKFSEVDYGKFKALTDIIDYRGPDASGYRTYAPDNNPQSFSIFLGHRRLSIIDLSEAGTQPLTSEGLHIIFNGEIFNYLELRAQLKERGASFKTDTDTEVILELYRMYGENSFEKLNGMWAFIIYDSNKNRVVVSRDRFSIKPLYYFKSGTKHYFSSEIKQLLPLLSKTDVNKQNLFSFLQQSLIDHNQDTFFKDIVKVPPQHNFIIDLNTGVTETKRYWDYQIEEVGGVDDFLDQFRELFFDSIRIRLRSDVKIGGLLSGGLDSSAITAIADKFQGGKFESFSVISKEKKYSEEKYIDIFSKQKNIINKKLLFEPDQVLQNIDQVLYHQDEPYLSLSVVAQYLIFKKIKTETDIIVVLSGQGGDEILMGYLKYYFFNLKNKIRSHQYLEASKMVLGSLYHRTILWQFNYGYAKRYIPFFAQKQQDYLKLKLDFTHTGSLKDLRLRQIADIDKFSVPALAHYEDRNSMAFGLEVRHPFLDHRLVNAMLNLKTSEKIKNGWSKYVLRQSMRELPDEIRWRRDKKGFSTPDEVWLKNDLQPIIRETFKNSALADLGIIDRDKFLKFYSGFVSSGNGFHGDIFKVFIAELWAKKFL